MRALLQVVQNRTGIQGRNHFFLTSRFREFLQRQHLTRFGKICTILRNRKERRIFLRKEKKGERNFFSWGMSAVCMNRWRHKPESTVDRDLGSPHSQVWRLPCSRWPWNPKLCLWLGTPMNPGGVLVLLCVDHTISLPDGSLSFLICRMRLQTARSPGGVGEFSRRTRGRGWAHCLALGKWSLGLNCVLWGLETSWTCSVAELTGGGCGHGGGGACTERVVCWDHWGQVWRGKRWGPHRACRWGGQQGGSCFGEGREDPVGLVRRGHRSSSDSADVSRKLRKFRPDTQKWF